MTLRMENLEKRTEKRKSCTLNCERRIIEINDDLPNQNAINLSAVILGVIR